MAPVYDTFLKALLLHEGGGVIRQMLFGGRVVESLATEQPQVSNRRADLVVRVDDGSIRHVELQASNEAGFGLRMLDYYVHLVRTHGTHVQQSVLYLGKEELRIERRYQSPSTIHEYSILDLRQFDAPELLSSADWADNILALLAKGDPRAAIRTVVPRLRETGPDERKLVTGALTVLSGILQLSQTLDDALAEADMIDLMENSILGPVLRRGMAKGIAQGRALGLDEGIAQGIAQGMAKGFDEGSLLGRRALIEEQLVAKFGPLPDWVAARLQSASSEELHHWAKRILTSTTIEETLRQP